MQNASSKALLTVDSTGSQVLLGTAGTGGIDGKLDEAGKITCPVLFNFAEADQYIPLEAIEKVKTTFAKSANVQIETYPGVHHGFNCWARESYNQPAATLAHGKTLEFLAKKM